MGTPELDASVGKVETGPLRALDYDQDSIVVGQRAYCAFTHRLQDPVRGLQGDAHEIRRCMKQFTKSNTAKRTESLASRICTPHSHAADDTLLSLQTRPV
jgi:hypothetical protein